MTRLLPISAVILSACIGSIEAGSTDDEAASEIDGGAVPTDSTDAGADLSIGLGYPVGDRTSYPAGGWVVWQVLGHYWGTYGGRHLAQDLASSTGSSVDAPVYSVGDGVVRYAGSNSSSYKHVVLIEHELSDGLRLCSFYGHVNEPLVETGQTVSRGEQITSVIDWAKAISGGASSNTHLHYVLLSKELCDASAEAQGALVCGYDKGGASAVVDLETEPREYAAVGDICGDSVYGNAFLSPTQIIEEYHFDRTSP